MRHHFPLRIPLVLSALLFLLPAVAYARFDLKFADGHHMTVSNYEENGNTVKVYTSLGSFAFQKNDIVNITDLDPGKKAKKPSATAKVTPVPAPMPDREHRDTAPVEHSPSVPRSSTRDAAPLQDVASQVEDGLFRMRYVFALVAGIKALKIFFAASAR